VLRIFLDAKAIQDSTAGSGVSSALVMAGRRTVPGSGATEGKFRVPALDEHLRLGNNKDSKAFSKIKMQRKRS
jgi:hypothetical protein